MTTPEEIKAEYTSSLADLTFNSKPLINVLTMLAEENLPNARIIVEAIEEHLAKVAVDVKLPILYLIDCIVKNVGQTYTALFSQNIVSTFCNVFKLVDEKTRSEMFKLRQTWNDVFPQMKLYAIDVQIHQIDPAWPVTAQPTNSIHFNPRFLINSTSTKQANNNQKTETSPATSSTVTPKVAPAADIETLLMQEQLIQKQKELLELQKKTLELEVLQTQVKLQEQIKAGRNPPIGTNILLKPEVAKQLIPEGSNRTKSGTLAGPAQTANRLKINPVNATLASARPIRDPRLMRLQPKVAGPAVSEKTPVESNKRVQNKQNVRENSKDPRLAGKKPKTPQKTRIDSPTKFNSGSSSSLSGSDSSLKGKQPRTIGAKHKKRDKGTDAKRPHQEYEPLKPDVNSESGKDFKSNSAKNRGRDQIKRNLIEETNTEDYRPAPKADKAVVDVPEPVAPEPTSKPMDVDLRQLNPAPPKKRPSAESSDQPSKKSRSFDVLFGSEDTDLRPLIPLQTEVEPVVDRPPTPPPPIISTEKRPVSPKRNDLDAVRAKLANATNREKALSKSFHKNKLHQDQDLRAKAPAKLTISPEEEKVIQSGHMTPEQGKQMLTKYLSRLEKDKLREAQKKDHEDTLGNESLQTISDDDDFGSDVEIVSVESNNAKPSSIPFNDKDERLNMHHSEDNGNYQNQQFYGRRASFRPARDGWRGGRGRNAPPSGSQSRQVRPWMHQQQSRWRGGYRPDFPSNEDDSSRSPGQDHNSQELTVLNEVNKTLPIDGINRDIRIYGDTAVIFMNYDDPREISFQNGARRAVFNNKESYLLTFGSGYAECPVNGVPFRVKLGAPTREIVIDDVGFECYFGGPPIHITVGGVKLMVALEGPPPQVNISDEKRTDLVAGKINMIVNATLMVPVFLDAKVQKFVLDGEVCTLKFTDSLKKVVINDVPFKVEFGGLPKPFMINGKKNFIRFSVLPKGITPGFVKIKDMEGESGVSPIREEKSEFSGPLVAEPLRPEVVKIGPISPENRSNSPTQTGLTNFDVLSNVLSQSFVAPATGGYQVQIPGLAPPQEAPKPALNINELFQKLVASGFVKTQEKPSEPTLAVESSSISKPPVPVLQNNVQKPQKRNLSVALKPVTFTRPETLKVRQSALYSILYTGMQCSSCGMRFPPEASMWYSQHLDWHFRQNRRGKKNARVANSRKWYYSLSDWKNYEELEDLEEREKNYFDQQQQQQAEVAEEAEEETEIPTVPADPRTTDERCYVCRDTFEQFFNEDKEEWHLRNAIRVDEHTYHPVCYEDHQKSILESSMDDSKIQEDDQNKKIPGLEIVLDDDEDNEEKENDEIVSLVDDDEEVKVPEDAPSPNKDEDVPIEDDGEDDDVILNEVAPIRIVVDDDDDEEPPFEPQESVTVKQEKKPIYDDGFIDVEEIVTLKDVGQVKIKSEPVDEDEMQTSFSEPVTDSTIKEVEVEEPRTTSHPQLITSMDGNVELSAPMVMVPTTISGGTNRIKINISKPLPVITPKEVNSENSDSNAIASPKELAPIEDLEVLSYKPALQNVPLKKLPPIKKGSELTGLCSIM